MSWTAPLSSTSSSWKVNTTFLRFPVDAQSLTSNHITRPAQHLLARTESRDSASNAADTPIFIVPVLTGGKVSDANDTFASAIQMPKDRPFCNLEAPSNMPERYQAVLDTPRELDGEKARRLRILLWRDRWNTIWTVSTETCSYAGVSKHVLIRWSMLRWMPDPFWTSGGYSHRVLTAKLVRSSRRSDTATRRTSLARLLPMAMLHLHRDGSASEYALPAG